MGEISRPFLLFFLFSLYKLTPLVYISTIHNLLTMPLKNSNRINVDLPHELYIDLKEHMWQRRTTLSIIVREAILNYLNATNKK